MRFSRLPGPPTQTWPRTTSLVATRLPRHVLNEAGRAVDPNGHQGLDHSDPAFLGDRCPLRSGSGPSRPPPCPHPEGRKLPYPDPGTSLLPPLQPWRLRSDHPRGSPARGCPSSTTGRPPSESDASTPVAGGRRRATRASAGEGSPRGPRSSSSGRGSLRRRGRSPRGR